MAGDHSCSARLRFAPIPGVQAIPPPRQAREGGGHLPVYLYKRGTFYPFVPLPVAEQRDSTASGCLKVTLAQDSRWSRTSNAGFPLGLPVH